MGAKRLKKITYQLHGRSQNTPQTYQRQARANVDLIQNPTERVATVAQIYQVAQPYEPHYGHSPHRTPEPRVRHRQAARLDPLRAYTPQKIQTPHP